MNDRGRGARTDSYRVRHREGQSRRLPENREREGLFSRDLHFILQNVLQEMEVHDGFLP